MVHHSEASAVRQIAARLGLFLGGTVLCVVVPVAATNAASEPKLDDLMAKGKQVYDTTCVVCHQPTGLGLSGTFPPLVAGAPFEADASVVEPLKQRGLYEDGKMVLGKAETQIEVVVNGIPGTRMFGFGHVLSNEDVAAVVTYIRNAWGNNSGDIVAAEQVQQFRQQ